MSRRKSKSTLKRLRREQAQRKKFAKQKLEEINDKRLKYGSVVLFFVGVGASFIHSAFAMLTILLPIMIFTPVFDRISRVLFGKPLEYNSMYSGKTNSWSDILLSLPLLMIGLLPMFYIGELADCYHASAFWDATFGLCK